VIIIYAIDTFSTLCSEIAIAKIRIDGLNGQRKELKKLLDAPMDIRGQQYSDMPVGSKNFMSLDRIVNIIYHIDNMLDIENGLLRGMFQTRDAINDKLKGLDGVDYQIVYKIDFEGKSFRTTAKELNYSSMQVGRIYKRIKDVPKLSLSCP